MPRYASQSDLERLYTTERIERMTSGGPGVIDTDEVEAALEAADDEVDTYLQGTVDLPIDPADVPRPLRLQAAKIALWYLAKDNITESIQAQYDSAIGALKRIQRGVGGLGLTESGDAAAKEGQVQTSERKSAGFGDDRLDEYSDML